jgi:hypothetical protein
MYVLYILSYISHVLIITLWKHYHTFHAKLKQSYELLLFSTIEISQLSY